MSSRLYKMVHHFGGWFCWGWSRTGFPGFRLPYALGVAASIMPHGAGGDPVFKVKWPCLLVIALIVHADVTSQWPKEDRLRVKWSLVQAA